jgi:ABC-2 type transport system permease protein
MRNILLIAKREYQEQIRGRAFKMSTIGLPAIFAVIIGVGYLSSLGIGANKHLVVAADDATLARDVRGRLVGEKDNKATVDVVAPATPQDRALLLDRVRSKSIDGFLWIGTGSGGLPVASYYSQSSGDFMTTAGLKEKLNDGIWERT